MQTYTYQPKGVCSMQGTFSIDDDNKLHNVSFIGGCNGNLKAIGKLLEGRDATEAVEVLKGNDCAGRGTSCADQFAKAVEAALAGGQA